MATRSPLSIRRATGRAVAAWLRGFHDAELEHASRIAESLFAVMMAPPERPLTPRTLAEWDELADSSQWRWRKAFGRGAKGAEAERRGREAYLHGEHLSTAQRGHAGVPGASWTGVPTTTGIADFETRGRVETSRVGTYLADVRRLTEAQSGAEYTAAAQAFRKYWRTHVRRAGGLELEADPDRIMALFAIAGVPPAVRYGRLAPR